MSKFQDEKIDIGNGLTIHIIGNDTKIYDSHDYYINLIKRNRPTDILMLSTITHHTQFPLPLDKAKASLVSHLNRLLFGIIG